MDDATIDWTLLHRAVAGECTPAERIRLAAWVAEDPSRDRLLASLRSMTEASSALIAEPDVERLWAGVRSRAMAAEVGPHPESVGHRSLGLRRARLRGVGGGDGLPIPRGRLLTACATFAATAVVLGVVGLVAHSVTRHTPRAALGREYVTVAGQRLSVRLPDGTQMTLAPASRARVPQIPANCRGGLLAARCSVESRVVELEGEAYFTVVHDAVHPFAVSTRGAVVRDVGTAFDVRGYAEDAGARIAVTEGEVAIATPAARITDARAGDVATVGPSGIAIEHGIDVASLTAWTDGRLVFRKTRFADVAREIGRFYDVDVRVPDSSLLAEEVTAEFSRESLDRMLTVLGLSLDAHVVRHGRTVVFTPKEAK